MICRIDPEEIARLDRPNPDERSAELPPLCPGHDHINLPFAAFGADQLLAPIEHWRFGAVPSSHLGRVGLDLMTAALAPHDQPDR
jgi:hypothetical protein